MCVSAVPYQSSQLASKPAIDVELYKKRSICQDRLSHVQCISETLWIQNVFYYSLTKNRKVNPYIKSS
jgi:hypothetical protein